jgi:hypothetical protein
MNINPLVINTFAIFLLAASVEPMMSQGVSENTCKLKSAQRLAERFFIIFDV